MKAASVKAGDLGEVAQHSTKSQGTLAFGQAIRSLSARDVRKGAEPEAGRERGWGVKWRCFGVRPWMVMYMTTV